MKLAVFYHCWLPDDAAVKLFCEQMAALRASGLEAAAEEIHIGLNGDPLNSCVVSSVVPRARVEAHGDNDRGEAATIQLLQRWLPRHRDWAVCYHHIKGVTHGEDAYANWRRCMEREIIWRWHRCVEDLRSGVDTVGAHWFMNLDQMYWAGNFWWASAKHLLRLPPIPTGTVSGRSYEAEVWIGRCRPKPTIRTYCTHALMSGCRS